MPEREPRSRSSGSRKTTESGTRESSGTRRAAPARKPASRTSSRRLDESKTAPQVRHKAPASLNPRKAAALAARHVQEMTGREPEGLTLLEHTEDGWRVGIEVLESHRIPDSTDILAVYEVILDKKGELVSYRREHRYHRGRAQEEQP